MQKNWILTLFTSAVLAGFANAQDAGTSGGGAASGAAPSTQTPAAESTGQNNASHVNTGTNVSNGNNPFVDNTKMPQMPPHSIPQPNPAVPPTANNASHVGTGTNEATGVNTATPAQSSARPQVDNVPPTNTSGSAYGEANPNANSTGK